MFRRSRTVNAEPRLQYASTLPIELIDPKATNDSEMVLLQWITATESNNDHFTVERSSDVRTWLPVLTHSGYRFQLFHDQLCGP